jgi:hypothetical protein
MPLVLRERLRNLRASVEQMQILRRAYSRRPPQTPDLNEMRRSTIAILILTGVLLLLLQLLPQQSGSVKTVPYSELLEQVQAGKVAKLEIDEREVLATLKDPKDRGPFAGR